MKIAHYNATLKKDDGVGRVILKLTEYARDHGHTSAIVTGFAEDADAFSATILHVPSMPIPFRSEYHVALPFSGALRKQLDTFAPDIIHLHSPDPLAGLAISYARERGIPVLITHHTNFARYLSYYHLGFLEPIVWALLRRIYRRADVVTATSETSAQELRAHGITNLKVNPWGIEPAMFDPKFRSETWRKKMGNGRDIPVILFLSRIVWEKDLETLAATYQLLKKKGKEFAMVVAGTGPALPKLQEMMPGATFLGYVTGNDLSTAYASADVFLFPSTTETFGNVTLEAMAAGAVPVVADAGGSRSIVQHGVTGLISEPKNAQSFYENTLSLLDDPGRRQTMRAAGLEYAAQFTWDHVLKQMFDLYTQLTER